MKLDAYINRLQKVTDNPTKWFYDVIKGRENYVLAIPKRRLGLLGTDANDKKISPAYKESTISRKKRKGLRTSVVTLKYTGRLYDSFKLINNTNAIDFTASTPYLSDLTSHYSSNELIGFSPKDEEQIVRLFIDPALDELINGVNIDIEL